MPLDENTQVPVKCPKCSHEFKKPLGEMKLDSKVVCPGCGHEGNAGAGYEEIRDVGKAFQNLKDLSRR